MEMKKKKVISKGLPHRCIAFLLLLVMLMSCVPGPFLTAVAADLESSAMLAEITEPTTDTAGNTEAAAESTASTEATIESTASTEVTAESVASTTATTESTAVPATTESAEVTENTSAATDTEPVETTFATIAAEESMPSDASTDIPMVSSVGFNGVVPLAEGDSGDEQSNIKVPFPGGFADKPSEGGFNGAGNLKHDIYYSAAGVTMQVVLLPYGKTYNRNDLYGSIIDLVQNYTYTDKNGNKVPTVYDGITLTENTFVGDPITGRIFKLDGIEFDKTVVSDKTGYNLYKTVPLVTALTDHGPTLHPGFHATVSGPADVSTENGVTTYTMREPDKIEKFLKQIIFGSNHGYWDDEDLAKDASGNPTHILAEDVSLYSQLLRYLGCEDEYIQNYLNAYNCRLSPEIHSEVLVPTIVWAFTVADCTWVEGNGTYGHGYVGDASYTEDFVYVDDYAVPCCDGKGVESGTKHGTVSNQTFHGIPRRQVITQVLTVGDIVYRSFADNGVADAQDSYNKWWRGIALDENPEIMDGYAATNVGGASCRYAYNKYHNKGRNGNGCSWYGYYSFACSMIFGNHNQHNSSDDRNYYGWHSVGAGFVNSINGEGIDANTGKQHYYRGFWSPYGIQRTGSLAIQKDITSEEASARTDLEGWKFELYETQADALAGVNYFNGAYTDFTGRATFEGLAAGQTYYIKEAPLERQDRRHALSGWTTEDEIFSATVTEDDVILVGTAYNIYVPGTPISISKSPKCSSAVYAQIENNPLYSLAGAEYTVYLGGVKQEVLVTDANGNATSSKVYQFGAALTIQETKAPAGFKLDSKVYSHTVNATDNNVEVTDEPVFDPTFVGFQKNNSSTGTAIGNTSYQGAIFKWEFWGGTSNTGTPARTWYFKTDALGMHGYDNTYLASSYPNDQLYIGADGGYELPLGYLVVTEVVAPEGYALMKPLHATITQNQSGGAAAFDWTDESWAYITQEAGGTYLGEEPVDEETFGSFSMIKMDYDFASYCDKQGDVSDLAAKFQIINRSTGPVKIGSFAAADPGEVCYEFWTGADGAYRSPNKLLPIGTYEIKEAQAPTGMTLNTTWSKTFTVTAQNKVFDFTADPCYDKVIRGGVQIYKEDTVLGADTGPDAKLDGITYSVISENYDPVFVNGVKYEYGNVVTTMELAWNDFEERWTAMTANNLLPYGTYKVVENPMEDGSSNANDSYMLSTEAYVFSIRNNNELVSTDTASSQMVFHNEPRTAEISVEKVDPNGEHLAGAKFLFEWSEDGTTWNPITFNNTETVVKGGCTNANIADGTLTTDETGILTVAGLHPYLQYRVTEIEAPSGYALLSDYAFVGTIPTDNRTVTLKVCNSYGYQLPTTGEGGFAAMVAGGTFLLLVALLSTVLLVSKRAQSTKVCYSKKLNKNKIS